MLYLSRDDCLKIRQCKINLQYLTLLDLKNAPHPMLYALYTGCGAKKEI